ncbi:MAG: ribonuclease III [Oscillospiraceae bacterium]|nr:ribonuclease III [Oscillospiraceae bacterium]
MRSLQETIGYTFRDPSLLETALTHTSYANEVYKDGLRSYERLEFLGDSILGFTAADYLGKTFPKLHEGELTKLRADLVCETSLAQTAKALGLGDYLRLGKGEEATGGRRRVSIIADVVEAVIAAIYLDGGLEAAQRFIYTHVLVDTKARIQLNADYKTMLQELVQQQKNQVLSYELLGESGPDHDKQFTVRVLLNGTPIGTGSGTSKKRAEQAAASAALEALR